MRYACVSRTVAWSRLKQFERGYDLRRREHELRTAMVEVALEWQQEMGVAPAITSALSEYDAAQLVGCPYECLVEQGVVKTAVSKNHDFVFNQKRYQVKANRPSGKPGSPVSKVAKAERDKRTGDYEWDFLIWVLYDRYYEVQEAWMWTSVEYQKELEHLGRISPQDMRKGQKMHRKDDHQSN